MSEMNRLSTASNPYQGEHKKVLCVCSAGLLRSPTTAVVLASDPFNFNTRAVGAVEEFALIPVDRVLLAWADEIVCMESAHAEVVNNKLKEYEFTREVIILGIPDNFEYRDEELMKLINSRYTERKGQ